jgi:hypothetical protein
MIFLQPIEPVYSTDYPSQKIHLYEGKIKCIYEINKNTYEFSGDGTIEYNWFPNPHPTFNIIHNSPIPDLDIVNLKLPGYENLIPGRAQSSRSSHNNNRHEYHLSGQLIDKAFIGKKDDLSNIVFHIVNFSSYIGTERTCKETETGEYCNWGRMTFVEGEYEIAIDEISSMDSLNNNLSDKLKKVGGYAITHVGQIKKKDNSNLNINEAEEIINIFSYFLSFLKGVQVSIVLCVGHNLVGETVYEQWKDPFVQPWKYRASWLPEHKMQEIPKIFPRFVSWWKDWGQVARTTINMYTESNHNDFGDIGIILSQSLLELIARVVLVEKKSIIAASRYDNRGRESLSPADKISLLLKELSISDSFPPSHVNAINDLVQFAVENIPELDRKNKSASEAVIVFTKIRNDITHAKKKYAPSDRVFYDTTSLGLWYVEMVILAILEYDGVYCNRLRKSKWAGEYDSVPWAKPEESEKPSVESSEANTIDK